MKDVYKYFDKFTFFAIITLVLTGILLIFSASREMGQNYWSRQLVWFGFSLVVFMVIFRVKTEMAFRYGIIIYGALIFILMIQFIGGEIVAGTRSWIKTGLFSIQISEFIKIPIALVLARTLTRFNVIGWKELLKISSIVGLPFLLIALQPDLGTAFMLLSFIFVSMLLKRTRLILIVVLVIIGLSGIFTTWNFVLKPYQKNRIASFLDPEKYKKSSGYQVIQSKIAIGSGGLTGKGYLNGTQSQYQFLPTRHTDFIVSVLGEEFGFMGISFLFLFFFVIFYRQYNFKVQSDEEFYFVYLFNSIILFQFIVNILMTIGFVPIMGVPLPFVSYGGSSLLAFFTGEALIFRIKISSYLNEF